MAIKGFRLNTGEVVLAELVDDNGETSIKITNSAQLVMQEIEPGKMGVGLQPFLPFSKGSITVYKYNITAEFDVDLQIENEYNRIFGAGIVIATADQLR